MKKSFLLSKINWAGLLLVLIGLEDFITKFDFADITLKGWVTFGIGVAVIIIRTYFTSRPIATKAETKV